MPTFTLELKPPRRKAAPHKAKNRYISPLARELAEAARERQESRTIKLADEFARAAREEGGEGEGGGSASNGPQPMAEPKLERAAAYGGAQARTAEPAEDRSVSRVQ